jgi:regulator of RNase E activity RraA
MEGIKRQTLEKLRKYDTPTISNAIERFNIRPRTCGYTNYKIKAILPLTEPIVGYACTAKISSRKIPTKDQKEMRFNYYQSVKESQNPVISVIQDLDPIPTGSFWGEVNASIHKAFGCVGTITNGGVRDLNELEKMNFVSFAKCILVSHAYVHIVSYNCEVNIGGLKIKPNDIIHADRHGVILIPKEILSELEEACQQTINAEKPVLEGIKKNRNKEISIETLRKWMAEMNKMRKI